MDISQYTNLQLAKTKNRLILRNLIYIVNSFFPFRRQFSYLDSLTPQVIPALYSIPTSTQTLLYAPMRVDIILLNVHT